MNYLTIIAILHEFAPIWAFITVNSPTAVSRAFSTDNALEYLNQNTF
jgi:beta-lactamase regulating signal transducer with metallopeptidase domain